MTSSNWNGGIGRKVEQGMSVSDMLKAANMDYTVKLSDIRFGDFGELSSDSKKVAYRSDTNALIDLYTNRKPLQNDQMVQLFQDFLNVAGLSITEIGSFDNGNSLWVSADLPVEYDWNVRAVGDITRSKLVLSDSHLNGRGMEVYTWSNRLVCTNGLTNKVNSKVAVITHSGGIDTAVVKTVLTGALRGLKLKGEIYETLAGVPMSVEEMTFNLINTLGDPDKPLDDQREVVKLAVKSFSGEGAGSEMMSAYNTAYGALQAVLDVYSNKTRTESAESRFASILRGDYAKKSREFERQLVSVYAR